MKQRGRKTKESLEGVAGTSLRRPDPPKDLNKRQKEIWLDVVSTEPLEFFSSYATCELLRDFVCHRETIENLTRMIERLDLGALTTAAALEPFEKLLNMRGQETRHSALVATRLRLTNQSRYTPRVAGTKARLSAKTRPWEEAA